MLKDGDCQAARKKRFSNDKGNSFSREVLSQERGRPTPFTHIDSSEGDIRYYEIDENRLGRGPVRLNWEHNPLETSLAQVPKMFREPEELRRILATATQYHVLDVGPRAPVKLPQPMKPATLPGAAGEDLVPYLYYLRENDLSTAINQCAELREFVNTIISACGGALIGGNVST